jgi:CRISPR/Cas system-associated exonuclease Cas4 (RecB family)
MGRLSSFRQLNMTLPTDFQFSQASLQDYVDCPRRFQLRHVLRLAWPALEAEPAVENERHLQQGATFHRLVHQHLLGIAPEWLSSAATDVDLRRWWHNYLERGPEDVPASRYPEVVLSAPLGGYRLVAKYDLVAVDAGRRAVIVDWKTSRRKPKRRVLAKRLQTQVYPYLLVRAGSHFNGGRPFEPEQVHMVYWFANFPDDPQRFAYDAAQYEADGVYLAALVDQIEGLGDEDFPLTTQEQRCGYCPYRSLCQRGVKAGAFDEAEDDVMPDDLSQFDLDLEQIAEIEF